MREVPEQRDAFECDDNCEHEGMTMPELPTAVPELPLSAEAQRTRVATPDFARFLNVEHGVIGRTVSTKFEPNTSSRFLKEAGKVGCSDASPLRFSA